MRPTVDSAVFLPVSLYAYISPHPLGRRMHVCRFEDPAGSKRLGLVDSTDGTVTGIDCAASTVDGVLRDGATWQSLGDDADGETLAIDEVTLLAPVRRPTNLVGIGLNYAGHAAEGGFDVPEEPIFFGKSPSSIVGPDEDVVEHPEVADLHYEAEFGFVVGSRARRVSPDEGESHVFGYLAANDVTARDMQAEDVDESKPWYRSKSMDTFTPLGPWVTPRTEGVDPGNAAIETRLNGEVVQSSDTSDLIFDVGEVVSYVSRHLTLHPGDVVLTGTPAGIGSMAPGDTVEVEVEGVGTLRSEVRGP